MPKYLFVYHGGTHPETDADVKAVLDAWGAWMGAMGAAVIDGGNPVGDGSTVNADGSVTAGGGANPATGYGLFEASNIEDALDKAKGCPILEYGGTVEVAEAIDM